MTGEAPAPPRVVDGLVTGLRADLEGVGFTVDRLADLLGASASEALHRDQLLPAVRVVARSDEPLADVVALFGLGQQVTAARLDAALPRVGAAGLRALRLAVDDEDGLRATCDLRPYGDEDATWWVASDLGEVTTGVPLHPTHVLGVGGASLTLASWTPRRLVRRMLDLGTGCGVQALHGSRHAQEVVATDVSQRTLAFARFNAALAGQDWDLRAGDLFEPVAGERFDLVVSNPPFVITPRGAGLPTYEYRDGGRTADALVREVVRGVGDHLEPGGIACFLADWETRAGQDWRDVWRSWLDGLGLDAFVVQRETQDVSEYAQTWARDSGQRSPQEAARWYGAWLDDFEARGVERIGFGVVVLVRPTTPRGLGRICSTPAAVSPHRWVRRCSPPSRHARGWPNTTTTRCSTPTGRSHPT